jgi:hypothetical protein
MIDKDRLALAALQIAQMLGGAEEWDDPAKLLEDVAQAINGAGVPAVDVEANRPYWQYMSPADALDDGLDTIGAPPVAIPNLSVHIDASLAPPEAISAVFDGLRSLIRAEGGPAATDVYGRTADN